MKQRVYSLFAILFFFWSARSYGQETTPYEFACRIVIPKSSSIVLPNGFRFTQNSFVNWGGSCWYTEMGRRHFVITNDHVVRGRPGAESHQFFALFNRFEARPVPLVLRAFQSSIDLAVFEIDSIYQPDLPHPAIIAPYSSVHAGDELSMITASPEDFAEVFEIIRGWVAATEFVFGNFFGQSFLKLQMPTMNGNSGSPIVDSLGRVVAMHSRKMVERYTIRVLDGDSSTPFDIDVPYGFGFAIPSDDIVALLDRVLMIPDTITNHRLLLGGIAVIAARNRYDNGSYVRFPVEILGVNDSGLSAAGLRPGDVLRAVNGIPIQSGADFVRYLFMRRFPGERVELLVMRRDSNGNIFEIRIMTTLIDGSSFLERQNR